MNSRNILASVTGKETIIIGAGLAGLFTALKLSPLPSIIISATPLGSDSSTSWAQGGIAAAISEGDSIAAHMADTIAAGDGLVYRKAAELITSQASERVADLLYYGVPFDRDLEDKLSFSLEAAHSQARILHVKGDMTGQAIMDSLIAAACRDSAITIVEGYAAFEITKHEDNVSGVYIYETSLNSPEGQQLYHIPTQKLVLATGGIGGLYRVTTNPVQAQGDGIAMAMKAGAQVADMEFVQFHPTAMDVNINPAPLATEALRGAGATLINKNGDRFMQVIHSDAELAARDIVARGVFNEIIAGRNAFLDCRNVKDDIKNEFPQVWANCHKVGINPVVDLIPVAPAAHYHMGGVATDLNGCTNIKGLWACGEVASTGVHGANRLASNSLLEAVIFAAIVAENISSMPFYNNIFPNYETKEVFTVDIWNITSKLRSLMHEKVGVVRDAIGLKECLQQLDIWLQEVPWNSVLHDNLKIAKMITINALDRTESRGSHYRSDFPEHDLKQCQRNYINYI